MFSVDRLKPHQGENPIKAAVPAKRGQPPVIAAMPLAQTTRDGSWFPPAARWRSIDQLAFSVAKTGERGEGMWPHSAVFINIVTHRGNLLDRCVRNPRGYWIK